MKNIRLEIDGDDLVIRLDLRQDHGPSRSGKTLVVGTTSGSIPVLLPGAPPGLTANVTIYRDFPRDDEDEGKLFPEHFPT